MLTRRDTGYSGKLPSFPTSLCLLYTFIHPSIRSYHINTTNHQKTTNLLTTTNRYEADHVFSLPTIYFFLATIAVFTIARFASEYAPARLSRTSIWRRSVASMRFLSYKTFRIRGHNSQSLGAYMLLSVGIIFFSAMTLGPRPYYWPTDAHYGNSPPIATRTGWMALACLPFVLLLGAKANMITALTGIPHEKLNIWHNWVSWAMFVLALIHTFPFVVFRTWKGDVHKEFVKGGIWLTGVIALIAQAWLTGISISWIRYVFSFLSSLASSLSIITYTPQ